ncbi:hypothetical protein [Amycolatopsis sp. La24]|uniref:HEAT repeat domain-containing protein n=1 Tax=Amycolatopsis sp. La24 TaxID=3028304 RepID=UPI0023B1D53B|nr:hypothetical protein [Amycolatopsis sp. La24]
MSITPSAGLGSRPGTGWTVFSGLDEIDWAGMKHAYGPATDVPDLLRGLVSPDPVVRERALDGMEGAVHHQLDVYDCTVAALPFLLEAAATPGLPGRAGVLGLVASIGGVGWEVPSTGPAAEAARTLTAAGPGLLSLLEDPDREVRRAVAGALPGCLDDLALVTSAVLARLPVESDAEVQVALVESAGMLGTGGEISAALESMAVGAQSARVRVAALTERVRIGPAQVPAGVVTALTAAVEAAYAEEPPPPRPDPVSTETLRGMLHQRGLSDGNSEPAPHLDRLVTDVSWAFGDRVAARSAFIAAQLRAANWAQRYHAVFAAQTLLFGWRGDHSELVSLIGDQLDDSPPRLRMQAATTLSIIGELAAPAADALVACIESAPRTGEYTPAGSLAWTVPNPYNGGGDVGPLIRALCHSGDSRALPVLRWLLEQDPVPNHLNGHIAGLGSQAAELVPLIRQRLRDLGANDDQARETLCRSLAEIGPAAAEAAPEVLAALESNPAQAASILTRIGAGAEAVPLLRPLLKNPDNGTAASAATALWQLDKDSETALPVILRALREGDNSTASAAAVGVRNLGPAAAATIPALRALLDRVDEYGWLHQNAATALWRITGDPEPVVAVLQSVWTRSRRRWPGIARDLTELGSAAAPAAPLLREALASPRRYLVERVAKSDDGLANDIDIVGDEAFQRDARTVLASIDVIRREDDRRDGSRKTRLGGA